MNDQAKTNQELIEEISILKQKIKELERTESENKRTEEALRRSEEKYRHLFESAGEGILIAQGERIQYANPALVKILGHSQDIVTNRPFTSFIHPEDRQMVLDRHLRRMSGEVMETDYPFRIITADGTEKWLQINSRVISWDGSPASLSFVMDITEHKRAEEALREREEKYRLLIENSHDIIYTLTPDGIFTFISPGWTVLLGHPIAQVVGKPFQPFVHPDDHGKCKEFLQRVVETGQRQRGIEYRVRHANGSWRWHNSNGVPLRDETGNIIGYEGIASDVTERKYAKEALQESEERYRTLVENASDIVFRTDQDGHFTFVNPAARRISGYEEGEIIGKRFSILLRPDMQEEALNFFGRQLVKGLQNTYSEYPILTKEGNEIWLGQNTQSLFVDNRVVGFQAVARDITECKRMEESLKESEEVFRLLFEKSSDAHLLIDGERYIDCNEAALRIGGCSNKSMLLNLTPADVAPERQPDGELSSEKAKRMLEIANNEGSNRFEWVNRGFDGIERHLEVTLTSIPMRGRRLTHTISRDITEQKKVDDEMREAQRRLSDIIEFFPDATLVIDKDGRVIAWNQAMEIMTGIKKEDMIGKGNYEYSLPFYGDRRPILIDLALHPDKEREKRYTAIQRVGDILFGESFTPSLPPGDIHLSATASVLRDSKGEIIAAIECIRDNTERKRLEERLNRAEKMEGLGRLAGGVAHDLNNVLGVLVGYSELLLQKLPEDSPLRRYAATILQSSMKGAAIIQDLLTLARRGVSVSEVVDLNKVVFAYLKTPEFETLKSYHGDVKIWTDLEDGLLNIKGSPIHLEKTLMNLVSNALEAISGRGEVTIRTENRYLDQPIRGYDDVKEGDYVVLTVSDSGRGIASQDVGKIFEPFYTKKVMGRSGTGLGLAVVWGTVKDHNGYIDVHSEEGKGTIFTLYFPITREELTKVKDAALLTMYKGRGESILVVDDVREQRELAMSILGWLGYRVEALNSGEEAIDYLKGKETDLVVLDMIMEPGIDGLETYKKILEIKPKQKAIIVSGFSETDRVKKTLEIGAGSFVRKPYILEKIGLAVRGELDRLDK
jgi:two-component system, cell cycle sensor histidine kinase and response regulator CckA